MNVKLSRFDRRPWVAYLVAMASTVLAILAVWLLQPILNEHHPFSILFFAVVFTAWYGGFVPAMAALFAGSLAVVYWIIPPSDSFAINQPEHQVGLSLYLFIGTVAALLSESQRRAQQRAVAIAAQARDKQHQLEREITERKRTERLLVESEGRFRAIAAAAPVMIWLADARGRCTFVNQGWLDFSGRGLPEELGWGWVELLDPRERHQTLVAIRSAFRQQQPFRMEIRMRRADGDYCWGLNIGVPVYGADGEFAGYIGTCLDISDRKQAEKSLREADRRKDEFLAMLAHELRNPLAPLRTGLELLRMGTDAATATWAYDVMERQLMQMVRLVDDLLDVSRITRGKVQLQKQRVSLAGVVTMAVETVQPMIDAHGHHLSVSLPEEDITIEADPARLAQVISNLLNNAAKYTEPRGQIWLTVEPAAESVSIRVRDTGIGISAEELSHIFELFAQSDRTLARAQGGLGIGLTLVRHLVEMHGGSISVDSPGPGQGSEFSVRLPLVAEEACDLSTTAFSGGDALARRRKILVVDDKRDLAECLARALHARGHETRAVFDGPAALAVAREFRPQVILLDLGMPGMDGLEVAQRVRIDPRLAETCLVALTGWGRPENRQRTREAGFDFHLVKPVSIETLERLLVQIDSQGRAVGA